MKSQDSSIQDDGSNITSIVCSFLSLNVSLVSNLPPIVLQNIASQAAKFEGFKSQKLLDDVSYGKDLTL